MNEKYPIIKIEPKQANYPYWLSTSAQNKHTIYVRGQLFPTDYRPIAMVVTRTTSRKGNALD